MLISLSFIFEEHFDLIERLNLFFRSFFLLSALAIFCFRRGSEAAAPKTKK